MKKLIALALLSAFIFPLSAQPKFIRKLLLEKDTSRRSNFIALPSLGYSQETGLDFGANALFSFYSDTIHRETHVSNIYGSASYTTKGQSKIGFKTDYWLPQNRYHLKGSVGYGNFPFNFYGIGNDTRDIDKDIVIQKNLYLSVAAEKLIAKHLYAGLEMEYDHYSFKEKVDGGIFGDNKQLAGRNGGNSILYGPSIVFDNRNSNTYTTKGVYIKLNAGLAGSMGNRNYRGSYFRLDARKYESLSEHLVLAFNLHYKTIAGEHVPFYLLYNFGNDEMMRGYYNGRFRDKNLLALQSELRYRFTDRFGIVAFGGTGSVFKQQFEFTDLKPNYGGGLRYFFDVQKGLSARIDYGIGEKRPGEKRQSGFYLSLSEAF